MDLKNFGKSLLAGGASAPLVPVVDFGIEIPSPTKKKTQRAFDCVDALKLFTPNEAVKMNYIPQMLIAVAMQQVTLFVNYCADNKISEFKKHNRALRACVEEFTEHLRDAYEDAYAAYARYVNQYFDRTEIERMQLWFTMSNLVMRAHPNTKWRDVGVHIAIIHNLIRYAEEYDVRMDRVIEQRMGEPVVRRQNKFLSLIEAMCIAIEDDYDVRIERDNSVDICMGVLANRAGTLADELVEIDLN